ncbi:pyridoxamine 5'-phosphate oxidase family protein [Floridanema evergladense]|uniref:Pyridoxamine 5'-phosphate oxidase family protein n=1 Tax=Floridaenema evergladense BLCC-F167 TaxID=3153639 RepID=A0ABV4WVQ6_9CYAN
MSFHPGEIAIQSMAQVREEAASLDRLIGNRISQGAQALLSTQSFAIAASVDRENRVWASLLIGEPGFVEVLDSHTIQIRFLPIISDPLFQNLLAHPQIGILIIDLENRRRLRLNGKAQVQIGSSSSTGERQNQMTIQLQEVFFNCPKYIQTRYQTATNQEPLAPLISSTRVSLNSTDRQWITTADTFFIASFYADTGADASHRGGFPGFVQVISPNQLVFPDYAGNNMFQTLGNLAVNPYAGLLFVNFEQGHTLQLTGTSKIIWEKERLSQITGAQRLIEFTIEQVLETQNVTPFRWQFGEYSPAIPAPA